jgi:hypothetical protein
MKFLKKHLNWVIFSSGLISWAIGYLIIWFILKMTNKIYFPFPGAEYIPASPSSTAPNNADYTIQAIVDIAVFLSTPVFIWILKTKQRSLWNILFFLPPLVMSGSSLTINMFPIVMPFWLIGWIKLLLLKNKSKLCYEEKNIRAKN